MFDAAEQRRRSGGTGDDYSAWRWHQTYERGLPQSWITQWQVALYNGRARDIHGKRIGTEYREGQFPYAGLDPTAPPTFESEAAYLKRHGLMTSAEERRLPPDAFEPETIGAQE